MSIKNNYCFESMREIQKKVLNEIQEKFDEGYEYVMVECPTGTGKSGIIASTALWKGNSWINTSSKLLQDQYTRDFKWMKVIKGRSNFECINPFEDKAYQSKLENMIAKGKKELPMIREKIMCDQGRCVKDKDYDCEVKPKGDQYHAINRGMKDKEKISYEKTMTYFVKGSKEPHERIIETPCKYYDQKYSGLSAGHTVMNYKYFFTTYFYQSELMGVRELLAFDEAHNIEKEIIDFVGITITKKTYEDFLDNIDIPNQKQPKFPRSRFEDKDTWINYMTEYMDYLNVAQAFYEQEKQPTVTQEFITDIEGMSKKIDWSLTKIKDDKSNWVFKIQYELDRTKVKDVKIWPIDAGRYIKPVFDMGEKKLFVSATLLDKKTFADMIGVPEKEIHFIRVPDSPFPIEHRQIQAMSLGEMTYKTMQGMLPIIAMNIDSIMNNHANERGIIHVTSYAQADYIRKNLSEINKSRLLITSSVQSQSDLLKDHSESNNTVILSPSMYEGVDLKDDLSRFQIVVKIPWLDLSDKWIQAKKEKYPTWYMWSTILRLVQSIGRSVRTETDYSATYVLDSKLGQIINNRMVPQYVRESVVTRR